jgi:membrane-associated phospholipid phosphatase
MSADILTIIISSFYSLIFEISLMLNNNLIFIPLILLIAYLFEKSRGVFFIIFSGLMTYIAKYMFFVERACQGLAFCLSDPAFPSGHAALAFSLAVLRLNKKDFLIFFLFALFVSYTRILISAHTINEVIAGLAMAIINMELWWCIWKK